MTKQPTSFAFSQVHHALLKQGFAATGPKDATHKLHTGPFTGEEASDGFTSIADEERALQEEADAFGAT